MAEGTKTWKLLKPSTYTWFSERIMRFWQTSERAAGSQPWAMSINSARPCMSPTMPAWPTRQALKRSDGCL